MHYQPEFDRYRPMQHWICILLRAGVTPATNDADVAAALPLPLTPLYKAFSSTRFELSPAKKHLAFVDYLQERDRAIPSAEQLDQAPELGKWSMAMKPSTICVLLGLVAGHPKFDWAPPNFTSVAVRIDPDRQWGRS